MDWHSYARRILKQLVRITTPEKSGTGFFLRYKKGVAEVATAAHVVRDARSWEQSIHLHHKAFKGGSLMLLPGEVDITLHPELDSACLTFALDALKLPKELVETVEPDKYVRPGVEVGWLGFPGMMAPGTACFFSGHISAYLDRRYFIDGVAVPGVSGAPAFYHDDQEGKLQILGTTTAYKSAGEITLGLMVADNVSWMGGTRGGN